MENSYRSKIGERSHLLHYSRIDVNVSVNFKGKQAISRGIVLFSLFIFLSLLPGSAPTDLPFRVLTTLLLIHGCRVMRRL